MHSDAWIWQNRRVRHSPAAVSLTAAPQLDRGLDDLAERMAGTAEGLVPRRSRSRPHLRRTAIESAFPRTCSDTVIDWARRGIRPSPLVSSRTWS